jgi:hypothetical protein
VARYAQNIGPKRVSFNVNIAVFWAMSPFNKLWDMSRVERDYLIHEKGSPGPDERGFYIPF